MAYDVGLNMNILFIPSPFLFVFLNGASEDTNYFGTQERIETLVKRQSGRESKGWTSKVRLQIYNLPKGCELGHRNVSLGWKIEWRDIYCN